MYIKIDNPEFPSGAEFDVGGLLLVNGKSVELTEEQIARYEAAHGVTVNKGLSNVEFVSVEAKKGGES